MSTKSPYSQLSKLIEIYAAAKVHHSHRYVLPFEMRISLEKDLKEAEQKLEEHIVSMMPDAPKKEQTKPFSGGEILLSIGERERATLLAALRFWQDYMDNEALTDKYSVYFDELATHGMTGLTFDEIDGLISEINS